MSVRAATTAGSIKRGLLLLVVSLLLGLATAAPPALAAQTHLPKGVVGTGELTTPEGLAVDQSNGDLYVADRGTGLVKRFDATGAPAPFSAGSNGIGPFTLPEGSNQIAVDSSGGVNDGHLYVANGERIEAFLPNGQPAPFSGSAAYISGNAITGLPTGSFTAPGSNGLNVDSHGDIYVADGSGLIQIFAPSGEALTSFLTRYPSTVVPDSTGFTYAGFGQIGYLSGYKPSSYPPTGATTYEESTLPFTPGRAVAVDPGNDQVYVTAPEDSVAQYASAADGNGPIDEFAVGGTFAEVSGIAVDRSGGAGEGDVYVASGAEVDRFGPLVALPDVVTAPASSVDSTAKSAVLNGTVDPAGVETTECVFEYGPTTTYGQTAPCEETATEIGAGEVPVPVEAELTGLADGDYHFRLAAANGNGAIKGGDQTFSIVNAPTIAGESAEPGQVEAQLVAQINPGNLQTQYRFEYGTTAAYGSSTQSANIAKGLSTVRAALGVVGLQPETTFHFRAVASNASGTVYGPDTTFTTNLGSAAGGCPNESLRIGPSALLPECRAYEMVSPVDKNGGGVFPINNTQAVASGDAIEYLSTNSFAGAPANVLNAYIARRGEGGWDTTGIDARQFNPDSFIEISSFATSEDLSKSLQFSFVALAPGAIEGGMNLYERDNVTGERTLVAAEPRNFRGQKLEELISRSSTHYGGGTSNWSRVYFNVRAALTPGAEAGVQNLYEFSNGRLSLVELPAMGSELAQPAAGLSITPDGRTLFLQSRAGYYYVSKEGAAPKLITASQRRGEEGQPIAPEGFTFSKNGAFAFFVSGAPLTDDAATESRGSLYRYDVSSGKLNDLTPVESPMVTYINQVSEDGSRVIVTADGALAPGSIPAEEPFNFNLFAWHQGEGFSEIGEPDPSAREGVVFEQLQVSPNGRYVAIGTFLSLTSADVPSASCPTNPVFFNPPEACRDIYVYDAVEKTFTCVSCNGPGAGFSNLPASQFTNVITGAPVHSVLDDGSVFFDTPNKLVPRDSNGVGDVYRYRDGSTTLISTGTDPDDSIFAEATPSGHDIFFRTSQRLVGQDVDSRIDLYDARVEGGIASQNPAGSLAPCEGDACKGAATSPPPPLGSKVGAAQDLCKAAAGRAAKARKAANRLATKAKKANGKQAKALRKHASQERKKAKKLTKQNTQCRRQGK